MGKFKQFWVFSMNRQCPWCHFLPDGCRCYLGDVTGGSLRHVLKYRNSTAENCHFQTQISWKQLGMQKNCQLGTILRIFCSLEIENNISIKLYGYPQEIWKHMIDWKFFKTFSTLWKSRKSANLIKFRRNLQFLTSNKHFWIFDKTLRNFPSWHFLDLWQSAIYLILNFIVRKSKLGVWRASLPNGNLTRKSLFWWVRSFWTQIIDIFSLQLLPFRLTVSKSFE